MRKSRAFYLKKEESVELVLKEIFAYFRIHEAWNYLRNE